MADSQTQNNLRSNYIDPPKGIHPELGKRCEWGHFYRKEHGQCPICDLPDSGRTVYLLEQVLSALNTLLAIEMAKSDKVRIQE